MLINTEIPEDNLKNVDSPLLSLDQQNFSLFWEKRIAKTKMQGSHNPLETSPSMHGRADLPLLVLVQLVPQLLLVVGQHLEPHALLWGDGGGARVSGKPQGGQAPWTGVGVEFRNGLMRRTIPNGMPPRIKSPKKIQPHVRGAILAAEIKSASFEKTVTVKTGGETQYCTEGNIILGDQTLFCAPPPPHKNSGCRSGFGEIAVHKNFCGEIDIDQTLGSISRASQLRQTPTAQHPRPSGQISLPRGRWLNSDRIRRICCVKHWRLQGGTTKPHVRLATSKKKIPKKGQLTYFLICFCWAAKNKIEPGEK